MFVAGTSKEVARTSKEVANSVDGVETRSNSDG
jgi:hypothetical protein